MNGFFIGYGLVAIAVAISLQGAPSETRLDYARKAMFAATWPLVVIVAGVMPVED